MCTLVARIVRLRPNFTVTFFVVSSFYDRIKAEIARDLESVGLPSDRVFNVDSFQGMLSHLIPHLFLEK